MKNKLLQGKRFTITGFQFLMIILLLLGIFFRFVNLEKKVYWLDETHTSLRIFGYREPEFIQEIFAGKVVNSEDLLKYQRPTPEKGIDDTMKVLAGNTEHTPLYYLLVRFWAQLFGSSVGAIRSLSAVVSLLAFPCIYWLCRELFESSLVRWIAIALLAISPFHVLYAQEARPYSLWALTILLASASLLRAMRVTGQGESHHADDLLKQQTTFSNPLLNWGIYAVAVAAGVYTHWFFAFVVIAHGIYVALIEGFRLTKTFMAYLVASFAGLVIFFPWVFAILTNPPPLRKQMGWIYQDIPLLSLVKMWGLNIGRIFFDLDRGLCFPIGSSSCRYFLGYDDPLTYLIILPVIILVGYSIYFLCRETSRRVWLFILTLGIIIALALLGPDLLVGGQRSSATRYLVPFILAIQLAVAYCIAMHISSFSASTRRPRIWQFVMMALISLGVVSCLVSSQADAWWNKGGNYHVAPIARILNAANHPLLLYSVPSNVVWGKGGAVGRVVPLSRQLSSEVKILFVVEPNFPKIPDGFNDVFAYRPPEKLSQWLEEKQNYKLEPVDDFLGSQTVRLWKLSK